MLTVNIVSALCFSIMLAGLLSVGYNLISRSRAQRIYYVRGFKRGKGALIYIVAIPLFWVGIARSGVSALEAFFKAVKQVVDLVVLKYDTAAVSEVMSQNDFFAFVIYFTFILVGLNALMLVTSLASQRLSYAFSNFRFFGLTRRERLIVIGKGRESRLVYKSEGYRAKILAGKITDAEALTLYTEGIAYRQVSDYSELVNKTVAAALRTPSRISVVVSCESDDESILVCRLFIDKLLSLDESARESFFLAVHIYVFGDPRYRAIYEDVTNDALGCISYVNKYQRVAMDFICDYPFTRFMTGEHIDYSTSCVREGVEINALLIGFGKTNQEIFLTSVANNQFITEGEGEAVLKPVRYYVFDKEHAENNKNLNHSYYRYKNECAGEREDDYLPLPDHPAEEHYLTLDVNDTSFYSNIRAIVTESERHVSFVIIAYGSDLENIDMARKLIEKRREWGVPNLTLFVKVRDGFGATSGLLDEDGCYIIGNERECVYDIERIISPVSFRMARLRDEIYSLEYEITEGRGSLLTQEKIDEIKRSAGRSWFTKKTENERDSSLYCALSLKSKLHMMGLDYVPRVEGEGLSREEYLGIYAKGDMPDDTYYTLKVDGKDIVHYTGEYIPSRRRNMAIHEHLRWNSYMISRGTVPATREQILTEVIVRDGKEKFTNGKSYSLRRHGNLTTFSGLVEFARMVAERDGTDEKRADVIKYDYQILDDAHWLLDRMGYMIVKRADAEV